MERRGVFIVFEGSDKSGKTIQCKQLVDALNKCGIQSEYFSFPDRSSRIGSIINDYLVGKVDMTDEVIHLLFSANRWEHQSMMKAKLTSGISLVVDRYSYSGIAFSAAKQSVDVKWCCNTEIGMLEPDIVFYLNANAETTAHRLESATERFENIGFQEKVKNIYMQMQSSIWQIVNANISIEEIHKHIFEKSRAIYHVVNDKDLNVIKSGNITL